MRKSSKEVIKEAAKPGQLGRCMSPVHEEGSEERIKVLLYMVMLMIVMVVSVFLLVIVVMGVEEKEIQFL